MADKKIQPKDPSTEKSSEGTRQVKKTSVKAIKSKRIARKKMAPKKF